MSEKINDHLTNWMSEVIVLVSVSFKQAYLFHTYVFNVWCFESFHDVVIDDPEQGEDADAMQAGVADVWGGAKDTLGGSL